MDHLIVYGIGFVAVVFVGYKIWNLLRGKSECNCGESGCSSSCCSHKQSAPK